MTAQSTCQQAAFRFSCSRQQTNDKSNTCTIDIIHFAKVEQDDVCISTLCLSICSVQHVFCKGVDFTLQVNNSNAWLVAYLCLKTFRWHYLLLSDTLSIRLYDGIRRC